ncbi:MULTISPECIES: 2-succinyl-5-enolpyruvyl-6-hydroxy-3-cyclohexene-1-carboxylic-acid synthase [unclassified Coleofasciculus]|uniref:2-succinyl-5-enolpyruvyl-6-hydroxy-3- cyclohexene-1-carboxylic-acid synthase n=1 Tax=unclassified Coleofasciculus TaxID=2692782 RepID=UPI00188039B9|nr:MULTISPECIES: 2-succinyl-5-enolpyruvyl-6-hydroxy-3-cyclohexene-1-carboxylic-acid synthase [unclassified Coleofasciculus]MBE9124578.1 2-succinyl-5-enolpyruvyl-6-hydroxy-3-cyclohexene-1-carboxylic-acid synthase [Coleofasciculus sp. LEGE 07081]MBE9150367.1 2-succinyl-5-enolpyruvyl-6-hydroxy-3-cyclohexene-1-carboxylic-acid synthase [Coleofasciculus sp. LEGE 07092]
MPIDFRNTNTVWASILAETLTRLGLTTAIICPGSRSTPLTVAFAQQSQIEAIPVLDERSAGFFALGLARKSGLPVALVCTSGTAGANFYPAVIEAKESRVPLLVLTADRPPELRDCHSGQTIDQVKLYGNYPNWQTELAVPSLEMGMLRYLRQTLIYAWERSLFPVPGSVHLNLPFRDPLAPIPQYDTETLQSQFQPAEFFAAISPTFPLPTPVRLIAHGEAHSLLPIPYPEWQQCPQGIIIVGLAQPQHPKEYCGAIAQLSKALRFPVLAEGLSPLRNYAQVNPYLISTYDLILRNRQLAQQLAPALVIHIGELPTSKELRLWLDEYQPRRWIIDSSHHNLDALHGKTTHLRMSVEALVATDWVTDVTDEGGSWKAGELGSIVSIPNYLQQWCEAEAKVRATVDQEMAAMKQLFEGKAAWLLSQCLPPGTPLFIANSMPVRDVEFFWVPGNTGVQPWFNRGANGIDGTLSTALGIAHRHQSSVMLTGDLALLHDTNGFLLKNKIVGHLTIVLINNNGGGIFEMLPISKFDPPFEEFFATPQAVNFAQLCLTYGVEHQLIESWEQLKQRLNTLPSTGIRVLELQTNRKADARWRHEYLGKLAAGIGEF